MALKICSKRRKPFGGTLFVNLSVGLSVFAILLGCSGVQGFFIDLEALGFSTARSDDGSDSSSGGSSEGSTLLVAAPSEQQKHEELVEVESKADPNKSVKLTLAELKQLVLGSVKDLTPSPAPINIKITTNKGRSTTTTPKPFKINKYKYKDSMLNIYANSKDPDSLSEEMASSYWKKPSGSLPPHTSFVLPPYDDEEIEHYTKSNEVGDYDTRPLKKGSSEDSGWFSAAKAVFRGPTKVVNSLTRWRGSSKPKKQEPRNRPIQDITYSRDELRRRRKRPPPRSSKRPVVRPRQRPGGHRRRGGVQNKYKQRPRRPSYSDEYSEAEYSSYYDSYPKKDTQRYSSSSGYFDKSWDRIDHLKEDRFDSNYPQDDTPFNMNPPL